MLLSVDDDDDEEEEAADEAKSHTNGLLASDDSAGGDAAHQKPQLDQFVSWHDDHNTDDGDDEDGEEEVLLKRSSDLRNGKFKGRSEEISEGSAQHQQQQLSTQVISHIAPAKASTSVSTASSSPLKSSTHIALARHPHDEADDICLVPEIDFEGMSTDAGSDNRESQPLLGGGSASHGSRFSELLGGLGRGHDHVGLVSNTFGGECASVGDYPKSYKWPSVWLQTLGSPSIPFSAMGTQRA